MEKLILKTLFSLSLVMLIVSCDDDTDPILPDAGTITGGPFTFVVDGQADNVSGISTDGNAVGSLASWVITDAENYILGTPPSMSDLENVDFDGAGTGVCLIWYIRYEEGLEGLTQSQNLSGLDGMYDLSNSIIVNRNALGGASIAGGPFNFVVDGSTDNVSGISINNTNVNGMNTTWVVTDEQNTILGLPPTLADVEGVDFDGAGTGTCFIWHLTYADGLMGLEAGGNTGSLTGSYVFSNSIVVNRLSAGMINGGPYTFSVDGNTDNVGNISVSGNKDFSNTGWVITDAQNNILGLPPTLSAVQGVDFDAAGAGVCLIWRITYQEGLTGLAAGNNVSELANGLYSLSNSISVTRASAGSIAGGPFNFTVDGTADNVSGITVSGNQDLANSIWVITDNQNNILGMPPTMNDLEGVDFDAAGAGVCLIWRLTYEDGLSGLGAGQNVSGLNGAVYSLSNSITVNRN